MQPDDDQQQPASSTPADSGVDEAWLAELRARTAQLTSQVQDDTLAAQILHIDSPDVDDEIVEKALHDQQLEDDHKKTTTERSADDPAVSMVRKKLAQIYASEPDAITEAVETEETPKKKRTKHQEFMHSLTTSGKSLAEIQTAWHHYYVLLSDAEKHDVWQEFYDAQKTLQEAATVAVQKPVFQQRIHEPKKHTRPEGPATISEVKQQIYAKVGGRGKLSAIQHVKSLLFGVGLATVVAAIITFIFFNEAFIAPFISPSKTVSATPILNTSEAVGPEPKIIIPKINLEVPVVFDMTSVDERSVQGQLENGVVHYASTPNPGEIGNSVVVGHSSNNILNKGKYKFAFVLLKRLEAEDIFFVQRNGVRYTYKVYKKEVVSPDQTEVLNAQDRANTMTLITCDPPGTSLNRLVVVAEQIAPDPAGNIAAATPIIDETATTLPSNSPSLWSRIWPF